MTAAGLGTKGVLQGLVLTMFLRGQAQGTALVAGTERNSATTRGHHLSGSSLGVRE